MEITSRIEQQLKNRETEQASLEGYKLDGDRIVSPGKFEGEPCFAPYYWELALQGFSDGDNGKVYSFRFAFNGNDKDCVFEAALKRWLGRKRALRMFEDSQGFVHCV